MSLHWRMPSVPVSNGFRISAVAFILCFLFAIPNASVAVRFAIKTPANDVVTMSEAVDVEGTGSPDGELVRVTVNGALVSETRISGGKWSARNVPLTKGTNNIRATMPNQVFAVAGVEIVPVKTHLVVRGDSDDNVSKRPTQRVHFAWNDSAGEIRKIALATTRGSPTPRQLDEFVEIVQNRTLDLFKDAYKAFDVQIASAGGVDVHKLSFVSAAPSGVLGSSPFDCGNNTLGQTSTIFVGSYRRQMTRSDFETVWSPMKGSDELDVRAEDVARALARTAVHESGHSLGLVGDRKYARDGCVWMDGCRDGHNCPEFDLPRRPDDGFEGTYRSAGGWHFMDPGEETSNNARLGEPNDQRTVPRVTPKFSVFSSSYLAIIHPPVVQPPPAQP